MCTTSSTGYSLKNPQKYLQKNSEIPKFSPANHSKVYKKSIDSVDLSRLLKRCNAGITQHINKRKNLVKNLKKQNKQDRSMSRGCSGTDPFTAEFIKFCELELKPGEHNYQFDLHKFSLKYLFKNHLFYWPQPSYLQ